MLNLAIFVSGGGSNFKSIHHAIFEGHLDADIRCVISSKADAKAVEFTRENGIPCFCEPLKKDLREDHAETLLTFLHDHHVDFIALCGYLRLLPLELVRAFKNRITNVHPALLPSFGGSGMYGQYVHEAVIRSGAKVSGATIHIVDEIYDNGAIVAQECIPVLSGDTAESLAARVLEVEHRLYPQTLQHFSMGNVHVEPSTGIATIQEGL